MQESGKVSEWIMGEYVDGFEKYLDTRFWIIMIFILVFWGVVVCMIVYIWMVSSFYLVKKLGLYQTVER